MDELEPAERDMHESLIADSEGDSTDEAKDAHDQAAVNSIRAQAIEKARERGIVMTAEQERVALGIFPKVRTRSTQIIRSSIDVLLAVR